MVPAGVQADRPGQARHDRAAGRRHPGHLQGRPLYRFGGDTKAGEANGEGIKDVGTWHAASPPQKAAEPRPNRSRNRKTPTRTAAGY